MDKTKLSIRLWQCVAPGEPNRMKKIMYLLSSASLGFLISFISYAWIEIMTIRSMYHHGTLAYFQSSHCIFKALEYAFFVLGTSGGFLVGKYCWRKIYVEKVWVKRINKLLKKTKNQ